MIKKFLFAAALILSVTGVIFFISGQIIKNDVFINSDNMILYTGHSKQLCINNYDGVCLWESDNPETAAVSDGTVTGLSPGTATIKCVTEDKKQFTCSVCVYESVSESYHQKAMAECEWLKTLSLSDGSFSCYEPEEGMKARINPYFGCYAAYAVVTCDYDGLMKAYAENFIAWYYAHINTESDVYGSTGTVYDYEAVTEGNTVIHEKPLYTYDSADSYGAVFFMLLNKYYKTYRNGDVILSEKAKTDIVAELLLSLTDNGYSESYKGSGIKYLMNNAEVYQGLKSALELYGELFNDVIMQKRLENAVYEFEKNFQDTWVDEEGFYFPVLDGYGNSFYGSVMKWEKLYEYALPQLFPVMFEITEAADELSRRLYTLFNASWNWTEMNYGNDTEANTTWSLICYAAAKMGDYSGADRYIEYYDINVVDRSYPFYLGDAVWYILACEEIHDYRQTIEEMGILP